MKSHLFLSFAALLFLASAEDDDDQLTVSHLTEEEFAAAEILDVGRLVDEHLNPVGGGPR